MKLQQSFLTKVILFAMLTLGLNNLAFNQTSTKISMDSVTKDEKIKFIGSEENMLIFELNLYDVPATGSTLVILDAEKNVIFRQKILYNSYTRRYKIVCDGISGVTFKISGKEFALNQSFSIRHRIEEKWEVKKS